jgi:hypothetical protein
MFFTFVLHCHPSNIYADKQIHMFQRIPGTYTYASYHIYESKEHAQDTYIYIYHKHNGITEQPN